MKEIRVTLDDDSDEDTFIRRYPNWPELKEAEKRKTKPVSIEVSQQLQWTPMKKEWQV